MSTTVETKVEKEAGTQRKTRYAICGLSTRGIYHFLLPLLGKSTTPGANDFSDVAEVVGVFDIDSKRVDTFNANQGLNLPFYAESDGIDAMIEKAKPDVLLVAGPDFTHCEHILAGLRHGLRVVAEKPLVINCEEMNRVLAAEKESTGSLVACHNMRYTGLHRTLRKLIKDGKIGRLINIEFVYNLDTRHGTSYFYRWNRERAKSGGLCIHKSVHHLDMINFVTGDVPDMVFSFGGLNYYGPNGAHRPRSADGQPLPLKETRENCPYFKQHYAGKIDPAKRITPGWDAMELPYDEQYAEDGYIYDDVIDIEDTYSTVVRFKSGASMTYSLNFSTPWEGYILALNGTEGRLELEHHSNPDPTGITTAAPSREKITFFPLFGGKEEFWVEPEVGGHGGSDPRIQRDLFMGESEESKDLGLVADSRDAAYAIATGEGMWRSIKDERPYKIKELLDDSF